MKHPNRILDRFVYNHPNFGIPNLINYILIGNIAVYVLDMFSQGAASAFLGLEFGAILHLQLWRLVTFVIVPDTNTPLWFIVSLFFYHFIGTSMEHTWGTARFNLFYLVGAILTFFASIVSYYWGSLGVGLPVTLSAIHQTLFLAFATLYPETYFRLYFLIPIKAKWLAAFYVFLSIWTIVSLNGFMLKLMLPYLLPALLASWANYLLFFWSDVREIFDRNLAAHKHQSSRQTINFKKAQQQVQQRKGYLHKCAVCGITDADNPNMEFRYCSKCNGYYCYCADHINNHTHVE